jgi:cytoskeletal protein CcmA (bactofilin family)
MSFGKKPTDGPENLIGPTATLPQPPTTTSGGNGSGTPQPSGSSKLEAFLGKNSKITGKLIFTGAVEIDGTVEGEIETNERLIVGESATVNAKITGAEVIIKGTVSGDVIAYKRLSLHRSAKVYGNVACNTISVEEGAIFEGHCTMPATNINQSHGGADLKVVNTSRSTDKAIPIK